jgi:hypothetical protein
MSLLDDLKRLGADLARVGADLDRFRTDLSKLDSSLPPDKDYTHFRQGAPMFKADSPGHDFAAADAAWMADASHLAYFGSAAAEARVNAAQYQHYQFLDLPEHTQAHVFSPVPGCVVVAFRGSEVMSRNRLEELGQAAVAGKGDSFFHLLLGPVADAFTDAQALLASWDKGGRVHSAFSRMVLQPPAPGQLRPELRSELRSAIAAAGGATPRVWFTGHSLGGALATLAADLHGGEETLYTFGSPRVGDADFSQGHAQRVSATWRMVHDRDLVARVPLHGGIGPGFGYQHVERAKFIDAAGTVRDPASPAEASSAPVGGVETTFEFLGRQLVNPGLLETIGGLIDHGPIFYAKKLWASAGFPNAR